MEIKTVFQSQYHAALEMLREAVIKCPANLWIRSGDQNPTWRLAYHAVFYTHLYLSPSEAAFIPWKKHRDQGQFLGRLPWPPHDPAADIQPYTVDEISEYVDSISNRLQPMLADLDLEGPSGFGWLLFGKLELLLYNLRHLQQHTGELYERIGNAGIQFDWIAL